MATQVTSEIDNRRKTRGFRAWNVAATRESGAFTENQTWLAEPGNAKLIDDQIAPGFSPDQKYDLAFFGGKTVSNLVVQVFYVSSNDKAWAASDSASIDGAFTEAFSDWRLTTVMSQYFQQPITTNFNASAAMSNNLDTYQQTDVENLVTAQYKNGTITGDFPNTIFCLLLAPGIRLYDSSGDDSYNGLGGYHGSVDIARANGTGTDRVYYAVGVYSQKLSNGTTNGINVFSASWKNVVATFYHEINEMRTDADVELATATNTKVLGWYSTNYGEIGDIPMTEAGSNLTEVILDANLADGSGTVPIQLMYSNMDHGPSFGLDNGALLREANGAIWVVFGGARFHVPDMPTLNRLYAGKPIIGVATGGVNGLSTAPADGMLLREENGAIWVVFGGAIFHVPDMPTLNRLYSGKPVGQLWNGAPETVGTIPVDGTLLREENGFIWVVFGGAIFHVPDMPTLNRLYSGKPVGQLWNGGPETIGTIPLDGTLLREENGAIWVVFGGAIFHVPDMPTLNRLYSGKPVGQLWNGGPETIGTIPVEGTLLREENGAIWVVFGGGRFHVPDPATLARLYGGRPIDQLWNGGPEVLSLIPKDGTLLREESSAQVYMISGGAKVPVQPPYVGTVEIVWNGALSQIP